MKSIKTDWTFADGTTTEVEASLDYLGVLTVIDTETNEVLEDEYSIKDFPELTQEA